MDSASASVLTHFGPSFSIGACDCSAASDAFRLPTSTSLSLKSMPPWGGSITARMACARLAMIRSKRTGSRRIRWFDFASTTSVRQS